MQQQEGDQMIRAEQRARHRRLKFVRHPVMAAPGVEFGGRINEAARSATPINEALDDAHSEKRDACGIPASIGDGRLAQGSG